MKHLTNKEKGRIIRLHNQGWNSFEISEMMDLPESWVREFIFNYEIEEV